MITTMIPIITGVSGFPLDEGGICARVIASGRVMIEHIL